ncbi:MAG: radical SAM protein [Anaerolineales bacterium]|nr:radical SAM protein [Anaerolineales bacterium]
MDAVDKLRFLNQQTLLEPAEEAESAARPAGWVDPHRRAPCGHSPAALRAAFDSGPQAPALKSSLVRKPSALGIHQAALPGGGRLALLKTMLTSACERNCYYCPFRAGRNYRRATFKPDEMAQVFTQIAAGGAANGLFLSSGVAGGGARTQDRLLDTIDILRAKHHFGGYVHLKLMPGVERDQVRRAMQLSDRVSINLEAPTTARLQRLAPQKVFVEELLQPLRWVDEIRRGEAPRGAFKGRWPSVVTQFVVGAVGEDDLEILTASSYLLRQLRLARVYYSAFRPVPQTPLEALPAENPWREHRLYQASFLLRDYGFDLEDLPFTPAGRLPLEVDPKLGWAAANLTERPVELNRADRPTLLRVPGIGPKSADTLLQARRRGRLRDLRDLQQLGINANRAAPYILLDGRAPNHQPRLF